VTILLGGHVTFVSFREDPKTGLPTLCRFAAEVRCSSFNQPPEVIERWYAAFRVYWQLLQDNAIIFKSKPGKTLTDKSATLWGSALNLHCQLGQK